MVAAGYSSGVWVRARTEEDAKSLAAEADIHEGIAKRRRQRTEARLRLDQLPRLVRLAAFLAVAVTIVAGLVVIGG